MRLHFFPALLPLAPMIPWFLTALGAIATALRKIRHRRHWAWIAASLFVAAIGVALWQKSRIPSPTEGTHLTPNAELPKTERFTTAPRASVPEDPKNRQTHSRLQDVWYKLTARRPISATVASRDTLIVGTFEGEVQGIATHSGDILWSFKKSEPVLASAAILNNTAFIGEGLHTAVSAALTAVDTLTGRVLWQRVFLGHIEAPPEVDPALGRLYAVTGPGGLWAIDATNGEILWRAKLGHADSTPLLHDGALWTTAQPDDHENASYFHEVDPKTGKSRFQTKIQGQPWGELTTIENNILFTTGVGQVGAVGTRDRGWSHSFSSSTHQLNWSIALDTMALPRSAASAKLGLVFHTLKSGKVVALNLRSGRKVWEYDLASACLSGPTLIERGRAGEDLLIVFPSDGKLAIFDAATGKLLERTEAGSNATAPPLAIGNRIFTIAGDSLSAFDLSGS